MEKWLALATLLGAVAALGFAVIMALRVLKAPEGTEKMKKIASAIRSGANAFLKRQYKVVVVFFACMFLVLGIMGRLSICNSFTFLYNRLAA